MAYPQNGDRIVAIDSVTSLHLMYAGLFPSSFLPARRYASARTIARALCLSVCLSVSVSLSQVGVLSKLLDGSRGFLACRLLSTCRTLRYKRNSDIYKKGTSPCNLVQNSGLRRICFGISIFETCCRLSSRKVDAHRQINWTVVG